MIVAMVVDPDADRAAAGRRAVRLPRQAVRRPAAASVLRAGFYLPQVLPVAVAGIVWGWILRPDGALNALLDAIGLRASRQDWLGDPNTRAADASWLVMVWVQLGYPVVIFMAALQRVDPELYEAAEIDGAGWWRAVPARSPSRRSGRRSSWSR